MTRTLGSVLKALLASLTLIASPVQATPSANDHQAGNTDARNLGSAGPGHRWIVVSSGRCNRDLVGSLIGGAAGGVIGAEVSDGDTGAILSGAVLGLMIGGAIGESIDRADRTCAGPVRAYRPQGRTMWWDEPTDMGVK